jgi:hypothetical protein
MELLSSGKVLGVFKVSTIPRFRRGQGSQAIRNRVRPGRFFQSFDDFALSPNTSSPHQTPLRFSRYLQDKSRFYSPPNSQIFCSSQLTIIICNHGCHRRSIQKIRRHCVRSNCFSLLFLICGLLTIGCSGDDVLELFKYAQKEKFAIPAVNVTSSSTAVAVLEAARDSKSPIILQISQGGAVSCSA